MLIIGPSSGEWEGATVKQNNGSEVVFETDFGKVSITRLLLTFDHYVKVVTLPFSVCLCVFVSICIRVSMCVCVCLLLLFLSLF